METNRWKKKNQKNPTIHASRDMPHLTDAEAIYS